MSSICVALTPELDAALEATPEARLVTSDAPKSERLTAWAVYGYRQWAQVAAREAKLAAYKQIAEQEAKDGYVAFATRRAAELGLI